MSEKTCYFVSGDGVFSCRQRANTLGCSQFQVICSCENTHHHALSEPQKGAIHGQVAKQSGAYSPPLTHTHHCRYTHLDICTYTHKPTYAPSHIHPKSLTHTHTNEQACTRATTTRMHIFTHIHALASIRPSNRTHLHTHMHTHTHAHTSTHVHTTYMRSHPYDPPHTHTHAHQQHHNPISKLYPKLTQKVNLVHSFIH